METISTANVAMITLVLLLVMVVPVFLSVGTVHQTPASPSQSPPCKQFNSTMLDCSARNFSAIPTGLLTTATGVDLSMNTISDLTRYDLYNLALLRNLNLSLNALQIISSNIFRNLISLQILDLSKNSIQYLNEDAFLGLVELVQLDLSKNNIISVPATAFRDLQNLQKLSLAFNDISEIPSDAMVHLRKVHTLDLSLNPFEGFGFQLGEGFKSMKNLKRLNLSGMNIKYLPNSSFSALQSLPVSFLDLSLNDLLVIDNGTFRSVENLRQLSVRDTYYDTLAKLPTGVLELDLGGVVPDVAPNGSLTVQVARRLSQYLPNITSISFARTNMKKIQDSALLYMKTLKKLDLSQNSLGFQPLYLTKKTFEGLINLEELDLSANSLREVPTDALSALNHTRSLRLLNLADNKLLHLNADVFVSTPLLTSLNLEGNRLSDLKNNLDVLQNLEHLYLANNMFYRLPPFGWETTLPGLQVLDISHNVGGEYVVDERGLGYLAPSLKELYASNIEYDFELAILLKCTSLVTLDVSQNGISDDSFYDLSGYGWAALTLSHLETLNLDGNLITFLSAAVFDGIPNLRSVSVSQNALETVDGRTLANLTKLEILDLSFNTLANISALNPQLPSLKSVTLLRNKVSFVDVKLLMANRQPALRVLDLSHNTYSCTCDIQHFRDWLLEDTRLFLKSPLNYRCNSPEDFQGDLVVSLVLDFCVSYLGLYLGVGLASGFVFIIAIAIFCVRYHWHLRYKVFLMFRRRMIRRQGGDDSGASDDGQENNSLDFDAFVSYNDHDRDWVLQQLIPHLEDHQEAADVRFRLCVSDRDLPAGDSKVDVIVEAIQCSRRTILVLSDHFLESEWCYYEMQMAHLRLFNEGRDVLILILLEEISDNKMTMLLRQTLLRKNYLKWPRDGLGQHLFWERLREELKRSPAVNHRLDV